MDVRLQAAERLLDKGVRFRLPGPFYKRLLRLNRLDVRPLRGGAILEIARVIIENGIEEHVKLEDWAFLEKNIEPVARCTAIAVLGTKERIEKEADALTEKLLWKIPAGKLVEMFRVIAVQNRLTDFTNITRLYLHQTTMMMNPRNLGQ